MKLRELVPFGNPETCDVLAMSVMPSASPCEVENAAQAEKAVMHMMPNSERQQIVLVVDDDPTFCTVMREALSRQGFTVYIASRALEALALLERTRPDIILTDIMMPDVDGIALIREIRSRANGSRIPTLVVSARGKHEVGEKARHAGANGFLAKPFSLKQLREAMEPYLPAMPGSGGTLEGSAA
jgi:CheY-like chemotaxis protein